MPRRLELGLIDEVEVVSYGEPGSRTFHISAFSRHGAGIVWVEKEQLFDVSSSLARALEVLGEDIDPDIDDEDDINLLGIEPHPDDILDDTVELKAWNIELSYDQARRLFMLMATGPHPDDEPRQSINTAEAQRVNFYFSHEHARQLAERGLETVYAGRPLCPHCAAPMDLGEEHLCQRRNGYHPDDAAAVGRALQDQ